MTDRHGEIRWEGLIKAVLIAIPGAFLPWIVAIFMMPWYEQAGLELPVLTLLWLRSYWLAWLLPVLVAVVWWLCRRRPDRDRMAFALAWMGAALISALSILAAWLPLLAVPGDIG